MSDRRSLLDLILAPSGRLPRPRLTRYHNRPNDDDPYLQLQRIASQDLLPEDHRHLSGHVLCHGLRVAARVRMRQLSRKPEAEEVYQRPGCRGRRRWKSIEEQTGKSIDDDNRYFPSVEINRWMNG